MTLKTTKKDPVPPDMRRRLASNRHGKLTAGQWQEIVMEPVIALLVLLLPVAFILGPRLLFIVSWGVWLVPLVSVGALGVVMFMRARRYARLPVHFAVLRAADRRRPLWMFWRPEVFITEQGEKIRFQRRLAPAVPTEPGHTYIVYYLRDTSRNVLLSLAPVDHTEAKYWQPSETFHARQARRA